MRGRPQRAAQKKKDGDYIRQEPNNERVIHVLTLGSKGLKHADSELKCSPRLKSSYHVQSADCHNQLTNHSARGVPESGTVHYLGTRWTPFGDENTPERPDSSGHEHTAVPTGDIYKTREKSVFVNRTFKRRESAVTLKTVYE